MQLHALTVKNLKPHPRNKDFFPDITGGKWDDFLESVRKSGILEPIIVTRDMVIVSGHQRVRACLEIGIETISGEIRDYESENDIIRDLIEINIRQRGDVGGSDIQLGNRYVELKRIYGIKHGNNQHKEDNKNVAIQNKEELYNVQVLTREDLAERLGVSTETLRWAEKLTTLPKEVQDLVSDGKITSSTASRLIAKLPENEQIAIANRISGNNNKATNADVKKIIEQYKKDLEKKEVEIGALQAENDELREEIDSAEPEIIEREVVKEVVPDDYEEMKQKAELATMHKKNFQSMKRQYDDMAEKWKEECREKEEIVEAWNKEKNEPAEHIKKSAIMFCAGISNFIERYGGYVWLTEHINELPEHEKNGFVGGINAVDAWVQQMKANLNMERNLNG